MTLRIESLNQLPKHLQKINAPKGSIAHNRQKRQTAKHLQLLKEVTTKPVRKNKYNAHKVIINGVTYDSKAEARHCEWLRSEERAGRISDLERQPRFDLFVDGIKIKTYTADAQYKDADGKQHVIDVKSPATAKSREFILTKKLMKAIHDIDVEVVT